MFEITPKNLYITGIFCFIIIGLANLSLFFINFQNTHILIKISSLASIIFNFALVGLFKYLLSLEPSVDTVAMSDDVNEIIEELKKK